MFSYPIGPDHITVFGLVLDALGIVLLFFYAPEKFPHPQTKAMFAIPSEVRISFEKAQKRRKRFSGAALAMIFVGFVLQIIAVVFW